MNDQDGRYTRLRYTATGALATLAVVGAIAGTTALAQGGGAKTPSKTATSPAPGKTQTPPPVNQQPFVDAIQRLVDDGTITAAQAQAVDNEIKTGTLDTQTLASSGFTPAQLQAVQQALGNAKRALAPSAAAARAPKVPPPAGACASR